jgi:NADH-quinone oxidoreductase subunit F
MLDPATTVLPAVEVGSFDDYVAAGGGEGLRRALTLPPEEVSRQILDSGLRGRGGAGFPTGRKWASVADAASDGSPVYLVCNAAEGEPGTFKDRALMGRNPYQLIEGVLIGLYATRAQRAFVATKERFHHQLQRVLEARDAAVEAGWWMADEVKVVPGPDEYLFGEESAMLEVIEHKLPMPRILPPYQTGLFATMQSPNPTVVNNVETLAHVPHIMAKGVEWFRERGTEETPGTMVFTVLGDVERPGVYELEMGTPFRTLIEGLAGARDVMAMYSGVSNTVITPDLLDLPLDFDSFGEAGTGLGSGGFMVYGAHRDIVQVCAVLARFLAVESCGQCLACKLGTAELFERLDKLVRGEGTRADLEEIRKRCITVTDQNRCYLPVGASLLIASTLETFPEAFSAHVGVASDPAVAVEVPKITDFDEDAGELLLDPDYYRKQADWSYLPAT